MIHVNMYRLKPFRNRTIEDGENWYILKAVLTVFNLELSVWFFPLSLSLSLAGEDLIRGFIHACAFFFFCICF